MSKRRVLLMLLVTLFVTSCETLNEPKVDICILMDNSLHCIPVDETKDDYEIPISDGMGYFCTSPNDFGEMRKHHKELHTRLEDKDRQ